MYIYLFIHTSLEESSLKCYRYFSLDQKISSALFCIASIFKLLKTFLPKQSHFEMKYIKSKRSKQRWREKRKMGVREKHIKIKTRDFNLWR